MTTGEHGLATGLGDTASVGVGGITLSGGLGFLVRRNGLTIDDVLGAEVVTADGAIGGMLVLPASAEVISRFVEAADAAPEGLSMIANVIKAPPVPFMPAERHRKPVVMASMVFAGNDDAGARAIAPVRALAPPLADMVRPIRYPEMYEGPEHPRPGFDAGTNLLVNGFASDAAEAILEHLETSTAHTAYVGFLGDDGDEGVRHAYPPAILERLAEVKRRYDPENLFSRNPNVHPTGVDHG